MTTHQLDAARAQLPATLARVGIALSVLTHKLDTAGDLAPVACLRKTKEMADAREAVKLFQEWIEPGLASELGLEEA